jgi:Uncharacterized protein conserved in bacteria
MNKINNKPKRAFIPQEIGNTIKKLNRDFVNKYGKIEYIVHSKWPEIVGSFFSKHSEPKKISRLADYENDIGEKIYKNYLHVDVTPSAALEFQHFQETILNKINSYFGYRAIVGLKIHQNYKINYNKTPNILKNIKTTDVDKKIIANKLKSMTNNNLKKTLTNLGINISNDYKEDNND